MTAVVHEWHVLKLRSLIIIATRARHCYPWNRRTSDPLELRRPESRYPMSNEIDLSDAIKQELQRLVSALKGRASAKRVWEQVLSPEEREALPLSEFLRKHCVDQYVRLRQVSRVRAVLDLAYGVDLLTENQYRRLLEANRELDCRQCDTPVWNAERCELSIRGRCVRRTRGRRMALNVHTILDTFQEEGWPARIDDPLTDGPNPRRLREAVRTLNTNLTGLHFRADGSGEGVLWEIA